jgi:hypothetical protein
MSLNLKRYVAIGQRNRFLVRGTVFIASGSMWAIGGELHWISVNSDPSGHLAERKSGVLRLV